MGELTCSIFFRYIKSKKQMVFTKIVKNTENKRKGLYILSLILLFFNYIWTAYFGTKLQAVSQILDHGNCERYKKLIPDITAWDRFT